MSTALTELVAYLDRYLAVAEIPDHRDALNGLQVEAVGPVERVAAAVDASAASIAGAVAEECELLLVHHGLFRDGNVPVTGRRYRRLKAALDAGLAVYSAHLPLDLHPEVGNNVLLAGALGVSVRGRFGAHEGMKLGVWGEIELTRAELEEKLEGVVAGPVRVIAGGPEVVRRVGVLTGGGGSYAGEAAALGLDALVTGEGSHHTYFDAVEGDVNLYYGGHYATETLGVRALAEHVAERFGLTWVFLDQPTGL